MAAGIESIQASILNRTKETLKALGVPSVGEVSDRKPSIAMINSWSSSEDELAESLAIYGNFKALLEFEVSKIKAKLGVLQAEFDNELQKEHYRCAEKRRDENAKKLSIVEQNAEAITMSDRLPLLQRQIVQTNSDFTAADGLLSGYTSGWTTISRIISIRTAKRGV